MLARATWYAHNPGGRGLRLPKLTLEEIDYMLSLPAPKSSKRRKKSLTKDLQDLWTKISRQGAGNTAVLSPASPFEPNTKCSSLPRLEPYERRHRPRNSPFYPSNQRNWNGRRALSLFQQYCKRCQLLRPHINGMRVQTYGKIAFTTQANQYTFLSK